MICNRCSHWNSEDDHRCARCATRLTDRVIATSLRYHGALALKPSPVAVAELDEDPEQVVQPETAPPAARLPKRFNSLQQSLFALRDAAKVVSIDGSSFDAPALPRPVRKQTPKKRQISASYLPEQGVLEFVPLVGPEPKKLATSVEARIACENPIASLTHRAAAAVWDFAIIGALIATFFGVIAWQCEGLVTALTNPVCLAVLGIAGGLLGFLYDAAFLLFRGETPGMRMAGLRFVDFDGRPATDFQLQKRVFGGIVSVLPMGMGLLWAMVDEESLSWRDHISGTFPTAGRE